MYHPMGSGAAHPAVLSIKFSDTPPANATQRVREIGAEIDPSLQMQPRRAAVGVLRRGAVRFSVDGAGGRLVTAAVLLLSAAGCTR